MHIRTRKLLILLILSALATALSELPHFAASEAHAQEESAQQAPFKIGVLNVSKDDDNSEEPTARVIDLLSRANGVEVDASGFLEAAEAEGLSQSILRTGDGRDGNRDKIGAAVRNAGLDVVILIDVYKKGRTMQLLMLGNQGQAIHESKTSLSKRGALSEDQGKELLRAAFEEGLPAIQQQREEDAERRKKEEEEKAAANAAKQGDGGTDDFGDDEDGFGDEEDEGEEKDEDVALTGPLPGELSLSLGGFFGLRGMVFQTGNIEIENTNPLIGASGRLRAFKGLSGGKMHVGLDADVSWAPFGSRAVENGTEVSLKGTFIRGGGVGKFAYALADILALGAHAGADVYSFTIESNADYTGHRYIWARAGVDILLLPTRDFMLGIHGSALPILKTDTSGGAYGEADSGFGFEAGATLKIDLTDSLGVLANYRYTSINIPSYSGSPFYTADTVIKSQDAMHSGSVNLSILF